MCFLEVQVLEEKRSATFCCGNVTNGSLALPGYQLRSQLNEHICVHSSADRNCLRAQPEFTRPPNST